MSAVLTSNSLPERRCRVRVRGAVQGVGFRPFVYRLARANGLSGWVRNDGDGVEIEVQGPRVEAFLRALASERPALARIDAVEFTDIDPIAEYGFDVRKSRGGPIRTTITPDQPVCDDCLDELFDPQDRRFLYPFINCTNCGPRFTLTRTLPYDRRNTSMSVFPMCTDCAREYHDPADRRFHAEPNACPQCGPRLSMPVAEILERLRGGEIVAIKGLGGFHLACDARNESAVAALRTRKDREQKPFAVMVANPASARLYTLCGAAELSLLTSPARPIVLLRRRPSELAAGVAPGLPWLGIMLPYTPLHHLIFHAAAGRPVDRSWRTRPLPLALVMTSANPGGEPLVVDNEEAVRRLAGIADSIVTHDRGIVIRADDSVTRLVDGAPVFLRRARGFVPEPIKLVRQVPSILAVGALLKNTVCVTRGDEAFVSQHVGDLDNPETIRFFEQTVDHLLDVLRVEPAFVAHDLHPEFPNTRFAQGLGLPALAVQHHHAHVAAVVAEHKAAGPVLGVSLDGFGLGPDGEAWGGELIWTDGGWWRRVGHLRALPQPGGDAAARQPWRMAAAALHQLGRSEEIVERFREQPGAGVIAQMLEKGVNSPLTTSCGRLFDAACGLLGVVPRASFEGQAPMSLEGMVSRPRILRGGWHIQEGVLDLSPTLAQLPGCDVRRGAELFHGTLIAALTEWISTAANKFGVYTVVLSGGCLLNHVLADGLMRSLRERDLRPLLPRRLPPNDGAISLGQAWVAAMRVSDSDGWQY